MKKYVGKHIDSQILRSIYVSHHFPDKSTADREKIATLMGTSYQTAMKVYNKHMSMKDKVQTDDDVKDVSELLTPELITDEDDM